MKIIVFGATGMVGKGVLRQCLLDPEVESVLAIGRKPSGVSNSKLHDFVRTDMFDTDVNSGELSAYDACFFCLGVSSVGMSESQYTHLTYELTMGWARVLARENPAMRFLYISGMGTGGKSMWARVKKRTEDELLALFPNSLMIRLGAMRPMHGERAGRAGGAILLAVISPLWAFAPAALAYRHHHERGARPGDDPRGARRRREARVGERRPGGARTRQHPLTAGCYDDRKPRHVAVGSEGK